MRKYITMQKITAQQIRADFLCCTNVRKEPPVSEINPDPAAVVLRQIAGLQERTSRFLARVRGT